MHEGTTVKQKKRMWKISMETTALTLVPARQYDKLVVKSHLNEAEQRQSAYQVAETFFSFDLKKLFHGVISNTVSGH